MASLVVEPMAVVVAGRYSRPLPEYSYAREVLASARLRLSVYLPLSLLPLPFLSSFLRPQISESEYHRPFHHRKPMHHHKPLPSILPTIIRKIDASAIAIAIVAQKRGLDALHFTHSTHHFHRYLPKSIGRSLNTIMPALAHAPCPKSTSLSRWNAF